MANPVQALLAALAHATHREMVRQLLYMKNKNRLMRATLPERITITDRERSRLLKFGKPLGSAINQLITIVVPSTFARWVREEHSKKPRRHVRGRPKKLPDLRKLILKIGRETGWGYSRVLGEICKLTNRRSRGNP